MDRTEFLPSLMFGNGKTHSGSRISRLVCMRLYLCHKKDCLLLLPPPKKAVTMSSLGLGHSISQFSVNTSVVIHK